MMKCQGAMRLYTGTERMLLTGFPLYVLERALKQGKPFTDALYRDLAGNAFSGTIPLAIVMCTMLHLTPAQLGEGPPEKGSSADDALDANSISTLVG